MTMNASAAEAAWRWFRDDLGAPRYVCAPMVRQSELAFRLFVRRLGCGLTFAPMFVAASVVEAAAAAATNEDISHRFFDTDDADCPFIVQLCGDDPAVLARAVTLVQHRCNGVDLNLGCPQRCARQGHFGAYLLESPALIEDIVRAMVSVATVPITCKIRIQDDINDSIALAQRLERAGCAVLTVHGRLRTQRHHEGSCNWDAIRAVRAAVSIPVIANGGITSLADADACLAYTGCAAIMSATALLQNPALFSASIGPIVETAQAYLAVARQFPPKHSESARDHILTMVRPLCQEQHVDLWSVFSHHNVLTPDQLEACLAHLAARLEMPFESAALRKLLGHDCVALPSFKQIKWKQWKTSADSDSEGTMMGFEGEWVADY
ncbi:Aste57867_13421 [Aphanomyces stellatus]|uniref:tRNA-dihydrouridine(16/17) synthase [NAD(P)(+)] n=1 Tax=Aphanomyces stellatus TaxID=120398 RepID=A0A485KYE9_9STRA|nr:hypothetical protein As57867_013371 [Aphanomyces stellatus]VFT90260.1 Aste57867_13421 [Aphanomyces stellatus]